MQPEILGERNEVGHRPADLVIVAYLRQALFVPIIGARISRPQADEIHALLPFAHERHAQRGGQKISPFQARLVFKPHILSDRGELFFQRGGKVERKLFQQLLLTHRFFRFCGRVFRIYRRVFRIYGRVFRFFDRVFLLVFRICGRRRRFFALFLCACLFYLRAGFCFFAVFKKRVNVKARVKTQKIERDRRDQMRGEIAAALARIKIASVNFLQSKEIGKTLLNKLFEIFVFFPFKIKHGRKSDVDEPVFFQHAAIELGMRKSASAAQAVGD